VNESRSVNPVPYGGQYYAHAIGMCSIRVGAEKPLPRERAGLQEFDKVRKQINLENDSHTSSVADSVSDGKTVEGKQSHASQPENDEVARRPERDRLAL